MPIVTLTTDFGLRDSYVAQMKGVLLGINPQAQIVDVTHEIPPQDVHRAAIVIEQVVQAFPAGTTHVIVVDPGVGSDRALLAVQVAGQRFLAPDNGVLTRIVRRWQPEAIHRLTDKRFWNPGKEISKTFHGRDILSPVAAWSSLGTPLVEFGPLWEHPLVMLKICEPQSIESGIQGQIETIDSFGNLISNVQAKQLPPGDRSSLIVEVGDLQIRGLSENYSNGYPGEILALFGSGGKLEIAVNEGNAAKQLAIPIGSLIRVLSPKA